MSTPTHFDSYKGIFESVDESNKIKFELIVLDIGGDQTITELKRLHTEIDIFMVFVAIDCRNSFESLKGWVHKCREYNRSAPIMLVSTKVDLRDQIDCSYNLVTKKEIEDAYKEHGL